MADGAGGKIAGKLAETVARTKVSTTERLTPHYARLAHNVLEAFFDLTGGEVKATVGPLWGKVGDHPDAPDWLRRTGAFVARGSGQWQTLLAGQATGVALGSGLLALLTNELQPVIGDLMRDTPNIPLAPADAAAAQIRGLSWGPDLWTDAGQAGVNRDRFTALAQLAMTVLSAEQILDLLNRKTFDRDEALRLLKRAGWNADHADLYLRTARPLLTLADLAAMWNRQIVSTQDGRERAALLGYTADDFDKAAELGGEPPDLTSVLLAWRRGIIDEKRVDRALVQGPIRFEWLDVIKDLQWEPLPLSEAADAVNQGHLTLAQANKVARENGVKPEDFAVIVANAGIPPGPQEALDWLNRGLWTEADFRSAFLESRIKNKYIDLYLKSRRAVIPSETVGVMLRRGVIDVPRAVALWVEHGYTPDDAADLAANASAAKTQTTKDLTVAQIVALYTDRAIDAATATDWLGAAGYDDSEIGWILDLAELHRFQRLSAALISKVRNQYVTRRISQDQALSTLDAAQINPDQRDDLIALWELEREVVTKDLTPAQIVSAAKGGFVDIPTALDRLQGQGYSADDAGVLLKIGKVPGA